FFVEIPDGDFAVQPVERDDVVEMFLVAAAGHDGDLEMMAADQVGEDVREQLAALLNGVEPGRPEEQRHIRVTHQPQTLLQLQFVAPLSFSVIPRTVVMREIRVVHRIEDGVGSVEDARGASGGALRSEFAADGVGYETVGPADDLVEKGRADGVDMVGGEDAAGEEVNRVGATAFLVVPWRPAVVEMLPEIGGVDSPVFNLSKREVL